MLKICVVILSVLLQMGVAQAEVATKRDVEVVLQQFKVVKHGQSEVLEPADRIQPGEMVEYQVVYRNVSAHQVRQLQATLPIPAETEYVLGTASPKNVQVSVDGVAYAPIPLRRAVKLANGQVVEREVPVSEYRSLRWTLGDLSPKQKVVVSARVRLAPLSKVGGNGGANK